MTPLAAPGGPEQSNTCWAALLKWQSDQHALAVHVLIGCSYTARHVPLPATLSTACPPASLQLTAVRSEAGQRPVLRRCLLSRDRVALTQYAGCKAHSIPCLHGWSFVCMAKCARNELQRKTCCALPAHPCKCPETVQAHRTGGLNRPWLLHCHHRHQVPDRRQGLHSQGPQGRHALHRHVWRRQVRRHQQGACCVMLLRLLVCCCVPA